jgi:hypothetical protein
MGKSISLTKRHKTVVIIAVIIVVATVAGFFFYSTNYSVNPQRAATLPLSEMKSITGQNFTMWTTPSSNSSFILTYYNLTATNSSSTFIMIMSIKALASATVNSTVKIPANFTTENMYNETIEGLPSIEHTYNSSVSISNGTFRGFRYFIASFSKGNIFIAAGYADQYYFYILGDMKVSSIEKIVQSEINVMSSG